MPEKQASGLSDSLADVFKDVSDGWNITKTDVVHLGHVLGSFIVGGLVPFLSADVFPSLKNYLDSGALVTPQGLVVAGITATLSALWTLAGKAPSNSPLAIATQLIPNSVIQTEIKNLATSAGSAVENSIKKAGLFFIGFLLLASIAQATNPIGVPLGMVPSNGENCWLAMPFTNVNEYTLNNQTNYGLGVAYGLAFANVTPSTPTSVNIDPFVFLAVYDSVEIADWVNHTGPLSDDYGLMLGLPRLDSSIPEICLTLNWNSLTNGDPFKQSATIGIATSFPTDILSNFLVRKINF